MKKRNLQRIFAAFMASAMAMNLAACSSSDTSSDTSSSSSSSSTSTTTTTTTTTTDTTTSTDTSAADTTVEEEEEDLDLYKDADGNVVDLGGMNIIIRDWWSSGENTINNDYDEATAEWREYCQETYNFTITQVAVSDWGSAPSDFVDYATTGGDENYAFVLRSDASMISAMNSGLMYDLATLDCLDFTDDMFTRNKTHELWSKGSSIYCMNSGYSEARTGIYFNAQVLRDAGIDPESIYDMQANGTWTWDAYDQILAQCQRDLDNDGVDDIYGITVNESNMTTAAIFSNNGSYIGMDADGNYYYNLESAETMAALEWTQQMFAKYDNHDPEGAAWDYYKEEFLSGKVASMIDDEYCGTSGNFLADADFDIIFVMFPMGPSATTYVNVWSNNMVAIPACYSAEKAWAIAFAWMLYNTPAPGYEDYINMSAARAGIFDERAINETITMMMQGEHGTVNYASVIPSLSLGSDFTYGFGWWSTPSESVEAIRDTWKSYVDAANGK